MSVKFFFDVERTRDNLTHVYSRDVIVEYITGLISENIPFSLALVDIDNFKYINDTYGHIAGDKILETTAARLIEGFGESAVISRFGGDEFLLVMPEIVEYDGLWQLVHSAKKHLESAEIEDFSNLYITVTIGISRFPENALEYDGLFEKADKALYRGKTKGRNCFIIYLPEKHENVDLKSEKDKRLSSIYLHSVLFSQLTKSKKLSTGIKNLFNFLSSYFMLDHICIQRESQILFDKTHELSRTHDFVPVNLDLIRKNMNSSLETYYLNNTEQLLGSTDVKLYEQFKKQKIASIFYAEISCKGKLYGVLRVDTTFRRIWQHGDMDILYTAAKLIGLILYEKGLTLDDI